VFSQLSERKALPGYAHLLIYVNLVPLILTWEIQTMTTVLKYAQSSLVVCGTSYLATVPTVCLCFFLFLDGFGVTRVM
jgi:hypothetical protein